LLFTNVKYNINQMTQEDGIIWLGQQKNLIISSVLLMTVSTSNL